MSTPDTLAQRYGKRPEGRRRTVTVLGRPVGLLVLALWLAVVSLLLGWVVWATVLHNDAAVVSQEIGFDIVDDHSATITVDIKLRDDDVEAQCDLRAISHDKAIVGKVTYQPDPAQGRRHTIDLKTERRATTVEWLGCRALPEQTRYR